MSFNHYNATAQTRNPLTMIGMEDRHQKPLTPAVSVRSAQATSDLLTWSQSKVTPQQARAINREKVTQSSHNLLSHQEFQAPTIQKSKHLSRSESSVIAPSEKFANLTGENRGKSPVKTRHYRSMKGGAEKRNVTSWGGEEVGYVGKYNKLEDNSVSKKNTEERKRRNILHLTEQDKHKSVGSKSSNDLYQKNFTSSKGLIGGTGEGTTQNLKALSELSKGLQKLSVRRENEMNSSVLCRKESPKPKWR